ncbi:hypothetical protein [Dawidia soli]|uniref:Uncharacterized protein n=1 Tax=Dawidia soli TaxID=2782352 RepID=A0AAP2DFE0_9BACT|nr:hypothetical protein [Dawidia soli]MBT1690759.1 hypothetical protein [Dawidia soli]
MPSTQETDTLDALTIEQLQKLKLQEEIRNLRKPLWAQIPFISVITTLVIAFTGTTITIWQIKSKTEAVLAEQRQHFADEVEKLEEDKNQAQRLMDEALAKYQEARTEKAAVLSEKTEIANKANEMRELRLRDKEEDLRTRVTNLEKFYEDLRNRDNAYISGFTRGFVMKNPTVQADIARFAKDGEKELMEEWLKSQVLFTGIKRFQEYVRETAPPVNKQ